MSIVTDSYVVTKNDDGSTTTTETYTTYPMTRQEKITSSVLLGVVLAPVVIGLAIGVKDAIEEKREARKAAKQTNA